MLCEEPVGEVRLFEHAFPDVVAHPLVLRVARLATGFSNGSNHFPGMFDADDIVLLAMESPHGSLHHFCSKIRISSAADRDRSRKNIGLLGDQPEGADTAVRLARNVNAARVDTVLASDDVEYSQNQGQVGAQGFTGVIVPTLR